MSRYLHHSPSFNHVISLSSVLPSFIYIYISLISIFFLHPPHFSSCLLYPSMSHFHIFVPLSVSSVLYHTHIFKHAQSFYIWLFPLRSFSLSCWIMSLFVLLTFSKDISLCLVFLYSSSCAAHFSTAPSFRLSLECSSKLEHSNNLHKLLKADVVMCVQRVFCWWHVFTLLMTSGQTCHRGHHVCAGDLTVWI